MTFGPGAAGAASPSAGVNGEQPREVFDLKYVNHVAISPDGRSVAFTELFNGYVAPLPLTGGSIELNKDTKAIPVTRLGTDMGSYLHWSADSKSVYWMVGDRYHSRALTAAKPDAGVAVGLRLPTDQPTDAHALVGGRVVTMRDAQGTQEVIEDGVVLVRGQKIVAVGARGQVAIPAGTRELDVTGKTVMPGIVDVHAHAARALRAGAPRWHRGAPRPTRRSVPAGPGPSNRPTAPCRSRSWRYAPCRWPRTRPRSGRPEAAVPA